MKPQPLLKAFERCLKACNLEPMTRELYEFFHLRCDDIAHYDIQGYRHTYCTPEAFLQRMEDLQGILADRCACDEGDSFKYDYEFHIPTIKAEMLNLLQAHMPSIRKKCNKDLLNDLVAERDRLDKRIAELSD